jgi:hypothetical protein
LTIFFRGIQIKRRIEEGVHSAHAEAVAEWFRKEGGGEEVLKGREGSGDVVEYFFFCGAQEGKTAGERRKLRS